MKKIIKKKEEPVDVHDDALMVSLGLRCRPLEPRDPKVWTKSYSEKQDAKLVRHMLKNAFKHLNWPAPPKRIPVPGKLIITIKKDNRFTEMRHEKTFYKTIFVHNCWQHDIADILTKYVNRKGKSLVVKYNWNGKTYPPDQLPFWFGRPA
jgi:hypothetical protein